MTLLGTFFQQLQLTNIQLLLIMTKKIRPPLAPHRPSSTVNVTFDQCFALFSWDVPLFVQHASSLGGLHYHSLVVQWCVVAISRLMSTSFDDFHLVQNTLWNRRIPDRVTGYFCSNPVLMEKCHVLDRSHLENPRTKREVLTNWRQQQPRSRSVNKL